MISAYTVKTFLALIAGWALLYIGGAHFTLYFVAFGASLLALVFKELQAYDTGPVPNRARKAVTDDATDDDWYEEMHARIYPGSPYAEAAFLND